MAGLDEAFLRIRGRHPAAVRIRSARAILGSSVIRVFRKGTKEPLLNKLASLEIQSLASIRTQKTFRRKFELLLGHVHDTVHHLNVGNDRIHPGGKWGHCTKVLCLYLHEIVLHSRLFSDEVVDRLKYFLYVPIDSIVLKELKRVGAKKDFRRINEIARNQDFYDLQDTLGEAARRNHVPRIWFDDVWALRGGDVPKRSGRR